MVEERKSKQFMLMFNIDKAKSFGSILRQSAAFNVAEIWLVESPGEKVRMHTHGCRGTADKTTFRILTDLEGVKSHC